MPDLSVPTLFSVEGKTAVVTGGASGLGRMMAEALIQNGGRKVYIASRKEKELQKAADEMNALGKGKCEYVVADLGSKAGCDKLVQAIKEKEDRLDILVNNSGATWGAKYDDFPEVQGWDRVMALNVKSLFYVTSGLTELLAKGKSNTDPGRVINISSVAGLSTRAEGTSLSEQGHGLWSYNTSKAAVNSLTQTLAVTLGKRFITVNAILPGVFPSRMTAFGIKTGEDEMNKRQPMGRIGTTEDIAGLMLFLVSRGAAHVTGNLVAIDGGARL